MTWKKQTITSWPELRDKINELAAMDHVVCRGQGYNYDNGAIFSTLDRTFKDTNITDEKQKGDVEREIARRFLTYAPNYLPYAELMHLRDGPSFMMLMQHYGAPTRLVDWTYSVWIGAYFAARSDFKKDGIIIVFNGKELDDHAGKKHGHETPNVPLTGQDGLPKIMLNRYGPWVCRLMQMGHQIPRMIAQQGLFTVGGQLGVDHCKAIDEIIPDSVESQGKLILSFEAKLKPEILKALQQMGINGNTLFPGIDGVGKALTEYAHFPQSQRG
jgi:hypothetical protein